MGYVSTGSCRYGFMGVYARKQGFMLGFKGKIEATEVKGSKQDKGEEGRWPL